VGIDNSADLEEHGGRHDVLVSSSLFLFLMGFALECNGSCLVASSHRSLGFYLASPHSKRKMDQGRRTKGQEKPRKGIGRAGLNKRTMASVSVWFSFK